MAPEPAAPPALRHVRGLIDGLDDAMVALLAGRRRLVAAAARIKRGGGVPVRDPSRESRVLARARRLARRLGMPEESGERLAALLIAEACRQQGAGDLDQGAPPPPGRMLDTAMTPARIDLADTLLRLVPPPSRLALPLRLVPPAWQARLLERAMRHVLAAPLADGSLDFLAGRRLGIEVSDLGLGWVVSLCDGRLVACRQGEEAESTVRGSATDLLLMASRLEDADTLFFQRRLVLVGDTELGLTARNLLDQLPWERVPLGLRIALNRGARLARAARAAHRGGATTPALAMPGDRHESA